MSPPVSSGAPVQERRLGVLLSHLRPCAPPAARRGNHHHHHHHDLRVREAEGTGGLAASPCAADGSGETSGGQRCVFCEIVKGNKPAYKLYEDDVCLCILDTKPLSTGHSLIIPKRHFPSLQATPPSVIAAICCKLPLLSSAIVKATQCDAFNVLVNNGKVAGQVIFHTHVHLIPRRKGDNLWSSETYERNSIKHNQETKDLVSGIKELLFPPQDDSAEGSTIPKEL
uniref:HIT domain-containing protein n=1 Tax=Oryza rufipogon TaxID=4529 RepID=A0A0E0RFB9_ORYRU